MTPKQRMFVNEYLIDLNASAAYRRSGYTSGNPNVNGPRLLANAGIATAVQEAQAARAAATGVTAERVVVELARIAFGDARAIFSSAGELLPPAEWPNELSAAISGVEVATNSKGEGAVEHVAKVRFWDKVRALELLARHLGMLNDKLKLDASEGLAAALEAMRRARRG